MRVITVSANKGGEGKTSISRVLAEYSSRQGFRTLAIDMDPQCNLSQRFLTMDVDPTDPDGVLPPVHPSFDPNDTSWSGRSSVVDFYEAPGSGAVPYPTAYPNLEMIPGYGPRMREAELVTKGDVKEKILDRLSLVLNTDAVRAEYDVIVIDTAPSKSPLTVSAVRACTDLLVPCQMEPQSMEGLRGMIQLWRRENKLREPDNQIRLLGIVPNKIRATVGLHAKILGELRANKGLAPFILDTALGQRTAFAESDHPAAKPKSVFDLAASNPARREALALCEHVFARSAAARPLTEAA